MHSKLLLLLMLAVAGLAGGPQRMVLIKADGLPGDVVERWVQTKDPRTGASTLPWIERVFFTRGTHVRNYYVRGISLSAPSWSMIDTGQRLVIHGNAEYDRITLHCYDYLNFFPFYVNSARSRRADMPAVEVLDEAGIPLLIDRFNAGDRYQSMQLVQRGVKWRTLQRSLSERITTRSVRQLFDEWQTGFELAEIIGEQTEREIVRRMSQPNFRYLDFFFGDYDHVTHLANDTASSLEVLKKLDALVGRLWTAIEKSGHAEDTLFVLTSDHGMNSEPSVYSQGFNLIKFFNPGENGGHHVMTNRYPLTEYKMRGLDPFVNEVMTPSGESPYLAGQQQAYPTALLDLDGNERAGVHLRNNDLNRLHMLLQRIEEPEARKEFFALAAKLRPQWAQTLAELEPELAAHRRSLEHQEEIVAAIPKKRKYTTAERDQDLDDPPKRERAYLDRLQRDDQGYRAYAEWLKKMIAVNEKSTEKLSVESLIPRRFMGEPNRVHDLANYAVGPGRTIDYFEQLTRQKVRNNVQPGVSPTPIDLVALRVDEAGAASLRRQLGAFDYAVFVYSSADRQALVLTAQSGRTMKIRYVPVGRLKQDEDGGMTFERRAWAAGFPLQMFEDRDLAVPGDRAAWLSDWHTDAEWLAAAHRTMYSNGIVGLAEFFHPVQLSDQTALGRFEKRRFRMAEADLLLLASNHWNFNVRGFNPGGNHGSFFRVSTDATLMLSGAGVPAGLTIEKPYDTMSFVPTILRLLGLATDVQLESFPGDPIRELVGQGETSK